MIKSQTDDYAAGEQNNAKLVEQKEYSKLLSTLSEGEGYLKALLLKLSNSRGKQSRYLRGLMERLDGLVGYVGYELNTTTLPPPDDPTLCSSTYEEYPMQNMLATPSWLAAGSMLRKLSCGNSCIPGVVIPQEGWQRRPSGRVLGEYGYEGLKHGV